MGQVPEEMAGEADAEGLFNQGLDAHDRGELDNAQEFYLKAIELAPSMVVAYNNLGMVYIDKGMLDEAVEVLQKTVQLDPSYAEAYNNLGFVHRRKRDDLAAAEYYDKFLELEPAVEDAPRIRAWLEKVRAVKAAQPSPPAAPEAPESFADVIAAAGAAVGDVQVGQSPQAVIARGYQYFDEEDYEQALSEFRKAVALAPQDGAAHAGLGRTLARLGQYDEAIAELQKAALFNPSDALNHYALGNSFKALGRNEEAAASYERFLEIMPEAEDASGIRAWIEEVHGVAAPQAGGPADELYHKALMEFQEGELDTALATAEQAIATDEQHFQANLLLGRILLRKKDYLRAVAVLRHASEIRPENAEPYFFLGQAYEKRGLHDEARQAYETCLEVAPDGPQAARVSEWLWRAKQAGKTALGLRCEYCFRSFSEEELSFHEGKRICGECMANLGLAPAEAQEGWQNAVAFAPSEAVAEEEAVGALGWAIRVAGALFCLIGLCFLLFLVLAWTGVLGPDRLEAWNVSQNLEALGLDDMFVSLGVKLRVTGQRPGSKEHGSLQPKEQKSVEFETKPPKRALPLVKCIYDARVAGEEPARYTLAVAPTGAEIAETTGRFSWSPTERGVFSVEIRARAGEAQGVQKFDIEVAFPMEPDESMTVSPPGERRLILAADLTGDGLDDVVVCIPGGVSVYRQAEGRLLDGVKLEGEVVLPISAAAADIDGDDAPELLVLDWYSSKLHCWEWKGESFSPKFAPRNTLPSPDALAAGELDGDNIDDIVVAGWSNQALQIFTGSKEGLSGNPQRAACGGGTGMNLLAVVWSPLGSRLVFLPGLAEADEARVFGPASGREVLGKFSAAPGVGGKPVGAVVGDFGTEKQLALLFGGEDGKVVLMGFDDAGTAYEKKKTVLLGTPRPFSLAAGDMNGDGVDDLAVVYPEKLAVYLRRPPDEFMLAGEVAITGAWGPACCADLGGDGRKDIVVSCFNGSFRIVRVGRLED